MFSDPGGRNVDHLMMMMMMMMMMMITDVFRSRKAER